jgi:1-acyl-sn-glycerol-3-phosphate acyltransferase
MRKLREYEPYLTTLLSLVAPKTTVTSEPSLQQIFEQENKLIVAFNHAAPLSWIPAVSLLTKEVVAAGGGDRIPRGIMDSFFFQFAPLKPLAKWITQSDENLNFDQLVENLATADQTDLVVFPEGSNCWFGSSHEIQEFRSPRFIELSIRTGAPILLAVHSGSESWGQVIKFPPTYSAIIPFLPSWAQRGISKNGVVNMPMPPVPLEDFRMHCEIYRPKLKVEELAEDKHERKKQLQEEAQVIRHLMETSLANLREQSLMAAQAKLDSI